MPSPIEGSGMLLRGLFREKPLLLFSCRSSLCKHAFPYSSHHRVWI